ncbi:hypothetical protein KQI38_16625 [Tissierella carlieri]|uniref:Uncharacterized protein n=1 Tax=Tissierella carlieri TaxID=689904 RepID=A0ABT1S7S6_9FIRM|nr:hypothetical protein [Tissierella carlieri]MBU5313650.1 hypothetical protein [Tissierella carlieri]MCQ4922528.1 hypothetical protein [Tissierella carlieri]
MDEIINKIINIDKETVRMKLKTEEIIGDKEKELKETLQELEKKYVEEGRLEGEKTYNEIIRNGELEIERLKSQDVETLERIDKVYKGSKDKLIEGLWNSLFRGKE